MGAYSITRGVTAKPVKAVCYGAEGVGKTTFAAAWPNAVFIDVEDGSGHYDLARYPRPETWEILLDEIRSAASDPQIGTLVVDTADAAEQLCVKYLLKKHKANGIEGIAGGYGKGYTYLQEEFSKLFERLDACVDAGKNVLILAHAEIKKFEQPDELGAYDRWELKLSKKCKPLAKEWCDLLLFANFKTDMMKDEQTKKFRASGGKRRMMYASHTAAYDAKNRLGLPDEMPFDFKEIADKVPTNAVPSTAPVATQAEQPAIPADEAEAQAGAEAARDAKGPSLDEMNKYVKEIANGNMNAKPPKFEEVTEPEIQQLHQLMADYRVNEAQLRDAVGSRENNPYTDATPISEYDIAFVRDVLIAHWEAIVATIKERGETYKDLPF